MKFKRNIFISLLTIFLLLPGCGRKARDYTSLNVRIKSNPTTLDPAFIVDVSSGSLSAKLFNGLVRLNPKMDITPDIAQSWEISPQQTVYTFYLKKGVTFSNGREVKASDFKYSFERILSPEIPSSRRWLFASIEGAIPFMQGQGKEVSGLKVVDDYTLEITLIKPNSLFLTFLTMPNSYVVPQEEVIRLKKDFSNQPVGTGPFILEKWQHDNQVILKRNQNYFDKAPEIATLIYRIIPEDAQAVALFETGALDILEIPRPELNRFQTDPKFKDQVIEQQELNSYYLGLNCSRPPLDNITVRCAISHAIDKHKIVEKLFNNRVTESYGPIPPGIRGYSLPKERYPYDPNRAKALLKKAGFEKGLKLKLYQTADKEVLSITSVLQYYLKEVGIEVEIIQRDWSAFKEAINKGEADLFYLSWWADYPDAENFLYPLFHSKNSGPLGNRTFFKDHHLDTLLDRIPLLIDDKARVSLYQRIEQKVVNAAPWVFLWHRKSFIIHQPWIKGYRTFPIYNMDKGTIVRIEKMSEQAKN